MKFMAFATLGAGALGAVLIGIGLYVSSNMGSALARYPGSQYLGDKHFDAVSAGLGYIAEASTYRSTDDLANVSKWYRVHFGLELQDEDGNSRRTGCVSLAQSQQRLFVQRSIGVMLCPSRHRTVIYVRQALRIGR